MALEEKVRCNSDVELRDTSVKEDTPLLLRDRSNFKHGISNFQAMVNTIKGFLGTGILSLPLAFYYAGIWTALVLTFIIINVNVYCMHLLFLFRKGHVALDYPSVAKLAFLHGPDPLKKFADFAGAIVNFIMIAAQLGVCCVYFIFISDNIRQVVNYYLSSDPFSIQVYIAIVLVPILLLTQIPHLHYITPLSIVANVLYFAGLVIILQYIVRDLQPINSLPTFNSWSKLPLFFGIVMFAFEGNTLVLAIENKMFNPKSYAGWTGVLNISCALVLVFYCLLGFFGYLHFGDSIKDHGSITLNLPQDSKLYQAVKLFFALAVLLTYLVQFYVLMDLARGKILRRYEGDQKRACLMESMVRIGAVLFTFAMAELIPHIELFISLVGSFAATSLVFLFPPLIDTITYMDGNRLIVSRWRLISNVLIMVAGCVGTFAGTYSIVIDISNTF